MEGEEGCSGEGRVLLCALSLAASGRVAESQCGRRGNSGRRHSVGELLSAPAPIASCCVSVCGAVCGVMSFPIGHRAWPLRLQRTALRVLHTRATRSAAHQQGSHGPAGCIPQSKRASGEQWGIHALLTGAARSNAANDGPPVDACRADHTPVRKLSRNARCQFQLCRSGARPRTEAALLCLRLHSDSARFRPRPRCSD